MNKNRRNFIKILLLGGGALFVGKIFGSRIFEIFSSGSETVMDLKNFRVSKDKGELVISDKSGEEVFVIYKEK